MIFFLVEFVFIEKKKDRAGGRSEVKMKKDIYTHVGFFLILPHRYDRY
jgi:hypothetical protein